MKKFALCVLIPCLAFLHIPLHSETRTLHDDMKIALENFKTNLFDNDNFSHMFASFTDEVKHDFNEMVDDVWCLFGKIHDYCLKQLKDNVLFEKYKQFTCKKSISGTITFSLEDKNSCAELPALLTKNALLHDLELEIQPFYETLSPHEQDEYRTMMHNLCMFFVEISTECEQILGRYSSVEKALENGLHDSQQALRIECGLEYPFPSLVYTLG